MKSQKLDDIVWLKPREERETRNDMFLDPSYGIATLFSFL